MTERRHVIARALSKTAAHPDVEARHDFGDDRARYEAKTEDHHDHLIEIESGRVIEFQNDEIESLRHRGASEPGFRLVGNRLELYGVRLTNARDSGAPHRPDGAE